MFRKLFFLLVVLLLQACATPVTKQDDLLSLKPVCCTALNEIEFVQLHPTKKNKFKIDNDSPAFNFGNTKSYFSAFKLPSLDGKYFQVKSYFNGMMIGQYFEPIFISLNDKYQPLEIFSLKLQFIDSNLFGEQNANMEGLFKLTPDAKYLIAFTGKFDSEENYANIPPALLSYNVGDNVYFIPGQGHNIKLERSPTGKLMIRLKELED